MRILKTVALAGVAAAALWTGAAQALTFERVGNTISATGEFELGDYAKFKEELRKGETTAVVFANSPGGNFADSVRIGALIRQLGIKTIADGPCYSACAFAWVGGVERGMTQSAKVGFHAPYDHTIGKMSAAGTAIAGKYMGEMGCSNEFIIGMLDGGLRITYITLKDKQELEEEAGFVVKPITTQQEVDAFVGGK